MENVIMISRHRQWRAWQFGVRHSGLWRNSGGTSGNNNTPDWVFVAILVYVAVMLLFMFVWPTAAGYMMGAFIVIGLLGWVLSIFL